MSALLDVPAELQPVQAQLTAFLLRVEEQIQHALASDLPPVHRLVRHVERYRGKMVRPTLVGVTGLAAGATELSADHVKVAAVCEMIHLATLVHDDVLDEADTRRRASTVNALHGNETAVILGDYLISAAYTLCSTLDTNEAALVIGQTGMTLCSGELLQLHHRENFSLDEPTYYEIVRRKTASLIAAACRLGASATLRRSPSPAGPQPADLVARVEAFGLDIGVAFQIQDDLLDLTGEQSVVGKSVGKDVEKGKLTLPLIHHLTTADAPQRGRSLVLLDDASISPAQRTRALVTAMSGTDSIAFAQAQALRLIRRAQAAIEPLPPTPARQMLHLMAEAVVSRAF
jgi:octaprenyl-diphosphate synthase